jgi:hypothetical protein
MGRGRTVLRFLVLGTVSALLAGLVVRLRDEFTEGTEGVEDSEQTELDRTLLPGISVRA